MIFLYLTARVVAKYVLLVYVFTYIYAVGGNNLNP
jgi:hypothetical protein